MCNYLAYTYICTHTHTHSHARGHTYTHTHITHAPERRTSACSKKVRWGWGVWGTPPTFSRSGDMWPLLRISSMPLAAVSMKTRTVELEWVVVMGKYSVYVFMCMCVI
ncbi:hypothetical protein EON63_09480 [archaeon]|nr:MAG: hypothetical protein EON63_09480 [archaeon]